MSPPLLSRLPFLDLRGYRASDLPRDLTAALAVAVVSIPQGVAYAMIAGLPPALGLYAGAVPAIVGSLFRSSRHVIAGPTNALSLLVGGAVATLVASTGASPIQVAVTLALMVGVFQLAAGLLRLGSLVDYISNPVVLGYITGAGVLIGVGQLPNLTNTPMERGHLLHRLADWVSHLGDASPLAVAVGLGTTALVVGLRLIDKRIPGAIVAMVVGIGASLAFDLHGMGLRVVSDISPVPASLPPLTVPGMDDLHLLTPVAVAATVLSLVESSAVARAIAGSTGDRLDANTEFAGQGLANIAAAFTGGYPISGSPSRSSMNWLLGARSRLAGVFGGALVLIVIAVAGPVVDHTPVASLAGLLMVIAWDILDFKRMRTTLKGGLGDSLAFLTTLVGAWALELDKAIYLGVVISIVLFLRRARLLTVRELAVDPKGRLREATSELAPDDDELPALADGFAYCPQIRILHVEGSLFFGAASELQHILDVASVDPELRVLVVRLKRCQGLDITTAEVLRSHAQLLQSQGRHLLLVGMRPPIVERMRAFGLYDVLGEDHLFPTEPGWFAAMDHALEKALALLGQHCDADTCPLDSYLEMRRTRAAAKVQGPDAA
ncbi:MAG: SulP family inorganic anion transporter [Alphaproteobacteria bacterium]|nr:SulP family inorganic anion transporter [Alphaproteobacteria bacterium]